MIGAVRVSNLSLLLETVLILWSFDSIVYISVIQTFTFWHDSYLLCLEQY